MNAPYELTERELNHVCGGQGALGLGGGHKQQSTFPKQPEGLPPIVVAVGEAIGTVINAIGSMLPF
jgi:hypothetical protein